MSGWHNKPKGVKKPYVHPLPPIRSFLVLQSAQTSTSFRYNPVLGEFFRCRFEYKDGSNGFYIAEQGKPITSAQLCHRFFPKFRVCAVSHHPPISAYFYVSPANKVMIAGELRPKSRFLGNSVSTVMEGENRVTLMGKAEDGGTSTINICVNSSNVIDEDINRVCHLHAQYVRER